VSTPRPRTSASPLRRTRLRNGIGRGARYQWAHLVIFDKRVVAYQNGVFTTRMPPGRLAENPRGGRGCTPSAITNAIFERESRLGFKLVATAGNCVETNRSATAVRVTGLLARAGLKFRSPLLSPGLRACLFFCFPVAFHVRVEARCG